MEEFVRAVDVSRRGEDEQWQLVRSHKGIAVWRNEHTDLPIACLGRLHLDFPFESVVQAQRLERRLTWDLSLANSQEIGESEYLLEMVTVWPIPPIRFHATVRRMLHATQLWICWELRRESDGADAGFIGVCVEKTGQHESVVTVVMCCEPDSKLPRFLLNKFNAVWPTILSDLRRHLERQESMPLHWNHSRVSHPKQHRVFIPIFQVSLLITYLILLLYFPHLFLVSLSLVCLLNLPSSLKSLALKGFHQNVCDSRRMFVASIYFALWFGVLNACGVSERRGMLMALVFGILSHLCVPFHIDFNTLFQLA